VPVIIQGRRIRITAATALTAAAVVGIMSVGIFLLPTVLLAWRAATVDQDGARPSAASAARWDSSSVSNT
jgi:hypothetical protein